VEVNPPGDLLASGRDSDIFEYGSGLVLRRSREGKSMHAEARMMEYAREHGYPVPAVHEVSDDGADLVMERIDGSSMVAVMGSRPWTIGQQGNLLADLHQRLHEIPAPDWARDAPIGRGDRLVHLDLHPLNVMLTNTGPVVIDWPNACRGDGDTDVALTWLLISAGAIPAGRIRAAMMGWGRGKLIRAFLERFDPDALRLRLPELVELKSKDPHMSATETKAMRAMLDSSNSPRP
jgi:aminoglycoside phosphotransferase (APT) family kinase protein